MVNPYADQKKFMQACDQTVDNYNEEQYFLYCKLIDEETKEFFDAVNEEKDKEEQLKELLDIIVVTIGAIHSLGADAEGAWNEVVRSNMSKVDEVTGKVLKREDGKVLKGPKYSPANITPFLK